MTNICQIQYFFEDTSMFVTNLIGDDTIESLVILYLHIIYININILINKGYH